MAAIVKEIMNTEVFTLRTDDLVTDALSFILALGIGGAPVIGHNGSVVGVVSMRDLLRDRSGDLVVDRMNTPPVTVSESTSIAEAGRLLGETGYHRLVVVNRSRPVGIISTSDVIRGLLGMPAWHPDTFPHYDSDTGLTWTNDLDLVATRVEQVPEGGGIIVLIRGTAGERESTVWVEATDNMRRRLLDMITLPDSQSPILRRVLQTTATPLRFRAAAATDPGEREWLVTKMVGDLQTYWSAATRAAMTA